MKHSRLEKRINQIRKLTLLPLLGISFSAWSMYPSGEQYTGEFKTNTVVCTGKDFKLFQKNIINVNSNYNSWPEDLKSIYQSLMINKDNDKLSANYFCENIKVFNSMFALKNK